MGMLLIIEAVRLSKCPLYSVSLFYLYMLWFTSFIGETYFLLSFPDLFREVDGSTPPVLSNSLLAPLNTVSVEFNNVTSVSFSWLFEVMLEFCDVFLEVDEVMPDVFGCVLFTSLNSIVRCLSDLSCSSVTVSPDLMPSDCSVSRGL